jgi:protein-glutamine gamma-glutamyltransferase
MDASRRSLLQMLLPQWPGWSNLPRESRDALFVLGVIAWTILPHLPHLPMWCVALTAAVLLWRARLALNNAPLPGRWYLIGALVVAALLTLWTFRTLLGKEAGVTMLVVLMVLKTLELRARRDALVVFFLGFFLVLTNFLYSQSLAVAAAMVVSVWGLLSALVLAHMPVGRPSVRQAGTLAARAALLGAPVMVLMFMLFPRFGPLWGLPQDALAKTGLSGSLSLGGVAELAADDSIAFRVRFDGTPPSPDALYWRGPVLSRFDGRDWGRIEPGFPPALRPGAELRLSGAGIGYEMLIEPLRLPLLPMLEATPDREGAAPRVEGLRPTLGPDLQWRLDRPLVDRASVQARAWPSFEHGPRDPVVGLQDYLELPPGFNPRTLAWALTLQRRLGNADAMTLAGAVLAHIRQQSFSYTLAPGLYGDEQGRHAIDEFWIDRKLGFCEHFATAFVVVMRALDVPARVVTGYQGADRELQDGWLVVRQSHAHAWAEIWAAGRGWVRVDPTAAVAPERVERSQNLRPSQGFMANALNTVHPELLLNLRATWERLNHLWNQSVLNYSRSDQFELMDALGFDAPNWEDLGVVLIGLFSTAAAVGACWAWWEQRRQNPWQRLHGRIRATLQGLGVPAGLHEAPRTMATRVHSAMGEPGAELAQLLEALDRQRYGAGPMGIDSAAARRQWWRAFARSASQVGRARRTSAHAARESLQ